MGALQHIADVGMEPELAPLPVIPAVDEDLALRRLKKAAGQIHQRAFSGAGLAHDGHGGPLGDVQGKMLQNIPAAVGIAEGHIAKLDVAQKRLPVFPLGMEGVAVARLHLRRVGDLGLLLQKARDPLDGSLQGDEIRDVGGGHLNGLEDADGIGGEDGEGGKLQRLLQVHLSALQQDDGHRRRAEQQHQRDIHRIEPCGPDARLLHFAGKRPEGFAHLLLQHHGLGGARAGDALVKGPGDAGIELAHLPVPAEDLILEIPGEDGHRRHDEQDDQRQPPVQRQHGGEGPEHIAKLPEDIRKVPGDGIGDLVGVAHDPGQQIAHRGHIVKGEGKGLKMVKQLPAQVLPQMHIQLDGAVGKDHHRRRLKQHHRQIDGGIGHDALQGVLLDEVRNGVFLKQRQDHIHRGAQGVEQDQPRKRLLIPPQKGKELFPDAPAKGLSVVLLVKGRHQQSPPSISCARSSARSWIL